MFVWVWVLMVGEMASIGLNTSVIRFIPEYLEKNNFGKLRGLLFASRIVSVSISTLVAILGFAGLYYFGDLVSQYYILPGYLILICLPVFTLTDVQDCVARGFSWVNLALLPPYILRPVLILVSMVCAYLAEFPMTATTAAGSAIVATWATAIIQTICLGRRLSGVLEPSERNYDLGFWLKTSFPMLTILMFDVVLNYTDIILLTWFTSPTKVAIYYAAVKTMALIVFVRFAVSTAAANRFSAYNARGDKIALAKFIERAVSWTFWPSLAATIVILIVGWPLLYMFGPEFVEGYPILFILALGFLARAATGPAEFVFAMLGEQISCTAVFSLSAVLNLILNFALIPKFGLAGAASATSISIVFCSILLFFTAKYRLNINISIWRWKPQQQQQQHL